MPCLLWPSITSFGRFTSSSWRLMMVDGLWWSMMINGRRRTVICTMFVYMHGKRPAYPHTTFCILHVVCITCMCAIQRPCLCAPYVYTCVYIEISVRFWCGLWVKIACSRISQHLEVSATVAKIWTQHGAHRFATTVSGVQLVGEREGKQKFDKACGLMKWQYNNNDTRWCNMMQDR